MSNTKMKDLSKVVKCACGLPMRKKEWRDHHRSCKQASSVEVTRQDMEDLEAFEKRNFKE